MNKPWNNRAGRSKNRWRLLPLVAFLALGLAGMSATAASAAARAGAPAVPFKYSVSGTVTLTSPPPPGPGSTLTLTGAGNASHLGKASYKGSVVIDTISGTGVITDTLTETLTAANGETLTILCHQVATPVSSGVYKGTDQWTVTGGTGRFRGATGSGSGNTHIDLNTHTFTKAETGTIAY